MATPTKAQIEKYIDAADDELGPECCDDWVEDVRKYLASWDEVDQLKAQVERLRKICNHARFYSADDDIAKELFTIVNETPEQSLAARDVALLERIEVLIRNEYDDYDAIYSALEVIAGERRRIRSEASE